MAIHIFEAGDPGTLVHGLTPAQHEAVSTSAAPLCVLAAAGSGKTTVLTRRVARRILDGSARPEHTLVVTFTRKAAGELRGRLARLGAATGVRAGTFHAIAFAQLRRHWADRDIRPGVILSSPSAVVGALAGTAADRALTAAVLAEIHWAQVRLVPPSGYATAAAQAGRAVSGATPDDVATVFARYQEEKARRGSLDLDDLVTTCATVLETDEVAGAALRWRTRHVYVDEFQDVNPAQWRLLRAWIGNGPDLFVVGDPRQAVFGWNGADPTLLDRLPSLLPGLTVIRLDDNHRSTPQVVAAARAVLGSDRARATRPDGPLPLVSAHADDESEALAVARWLRVTHRPGSPWSHLAVLARTNARLNPVAEALERGGIPYRKASDRAELRRALGALRRLPRQRRMRSALAELVVESAARNADSDSDADGDGARLVSDLGRLADEHALDFPDATVGDFLQWVATHDAESESDGSDAVTLSTFHRAKGLQWPGVAIVGLEDGLVPIVHAITPDALAEEHRLLYVAITRAEDDLWCSWARTRRHGAKTWICDRSPMLDAIENAAREPVHEWRSLVAHLGDLRSMLPSAG